MHGLTLEIRYAFRSLMRAPGLFAVALITIALGVGANTAMFSVLHSVVLRPLPYPEADRLVSLWPEKRWSQGMLSDVRERVTSYEAIAVSTEQWLTLLGDGPAENVLGLATSASTFQVLGMGPTLGGGFVPGDAEGERGAVAVLSHEFWQGRYGADPSVLGRTIRLAGLGAEERTVVGVLPPGFPGLGSVGVVVPLAETPGLPGWYGPYGMQAMGRLRPGVTVAQASAELRGLVAELTPVHPTQFREIRYSPVDVVAAHEVTVRGIRTQLLVLMGAVGFILLIACTNVANLLLARAQARQREIAIQAALGGSAGRIMRHILTESALLGVLGGVVGVAAAYWALPLITGFVGGQVPRSEEIGMNTTVLLFALAVSLLAGLLFGAAPAVRAARTAPGQLLRGGGRGQTHGRRAGRLNDTLVGAEVALCLVLLAGAGLMIKSMWNLANVDTGLATENVLTMQYTVPPGRYGSDEELEMLRRRVEEEVAGVPGVAGVTFINYLPLSGSWAGMPYTLEGGAGDDVSYVVSARVVTPEFFDFFGIPLREGRLLGPEDAVAGGEDALVVNEAFARLHWSEGGAVGSRVMNSAGTEPLGTIVGVVGDARLGQLHEPAQPEIFGATSQYGFPGAGFLLVRGTRDVPSRDQVTRAVAAVDSEIALRNVRSMDDVLSAAAAGTRFYTRLLLGFAAIALALGVVGVYGVMSYAVSRRTRELGVRLALGASPRDVAVGVVRRAMGPVGVGMALGLVGALLLTRLLAGLVFEVEPNDPWVLGAVVLFLGAAGVIAAVIPAARAGRVSPVQAMQAE
jgi:putative ABC transport system permease protein